MDAGFEWIDCTDRDASVFSWIRRSGDDDWLLCVCNFTPVVRHGFRMGVPEAGQYRVVLNTDAAEYGGAGTTELELIDVEAVGANGRPASIELTLPPLATLWLTPVRE